MTATIPTVGLPAVRPRPAMTTTTIPTLGLAAVLAATLVACDVQTWEWKITIDGAPARCSDVGAGYVSLYVENVEADRVISHERYPCDLGSTTTSFADQPWIAFAQLQSPIEGTWPLYEITSAQILEDPAGEDHWKVELRFGTLISDFLPDRDGLCGNVVDYTVIVNGAVFFPRLARCGQPVVLPEQWSTLREFDIEVRGYVDVGAGVLRACHRTLTPVRRRIEGDPDPVPVPFNPAAEDAVACAPFAPASGDGCVTAETCDNGLDDDCNGDVDDGCLCTVGAVAACFAGPPGSRGVGACTEGTMVCQGAGEETLWGPCTGGVVPTAEICDGVDNDCDGAEDEGLTSCVVALACPDSASLPEGAPFQDYVLDAAPWFTGAATSWTWTVTGGPCDQLLGQTSYRLTGANTSRLTFRPTLSGDYTITLTVVAADGATHTCTFVVHVGGPGLRVEMCSDRTSDTDLDLHLHQPGMPDRGWFEAAGVNTCYWRNCKGSSPLASAANWGYPNSPLAACSGGPDGPAWTALGYCRSPRLDIDSIRQAGVPENINVDIPDNGAAYRVMVNYYSGTGTAHPLVNIYCGGRLKASYGRAPDLVPDFDEPGTDISGDMWRVADVAPVVAGGVTTDCTVTPLHVPGQTTGYWVATTPRTY